MSSEIPLSYDVIMQILKNKQAVSAVSELQPIVTSLDGLPVKSSGCGKCGSKQQMAQRALAQRAKNIITKLPPAKLTKLKQAMGYAESTSFRTFGRDPKTKRAKKILL